REDAQKDADAWRERLSRDELSLSFEVRIVESLFSDAARLAALHARYCDLAVITMAVEQTPDNYVVREYFTSLLLESGRPVMVVPPGFAWRAPKHIVVAWQPKRESTRALHDAMPFLRMAETV